MRKIIIWNLITLDAKFEGPTPWDLSFHELAWGPDLEALSLRQLREASALIFGKNTYQGMAAYWQTAEEPSAITTLMNSIPKIVCSTSLTLATWNNSTITSDPVTHLRHLKSLDDKPMYIFGSGNLIQTLLNANLIDELRLCIAPIILGNGTPLFSTTHSPKNLTLLESRPLPNHCTLLRYSVNKTN